jgi:hypothetical protein
MLCDFSEMYGIGETAILGLVVASAVVVMIFTYFRVEFYHFSIDTGHVSFDQWMLSKFHCFKMSDQPVQELQQPLSKKEMTTVRVVMVLLIMTGVIIVLNLLNETSLMLEVVIITINILCTSIIVPLLIIRRNGHILNYSLTQIQGIWASIKGQF